MDINALINTKTQLTPSQTLGLKIGQQLEAKVAKADTEKNAITLSLGNKSISVQSNQPVALPPGQALKIEVTQISPRIEFKITGPLPELKDQVGQNQNPKAPPTELRLTLNATAARVGGSVNLTANEKALPLPEAQPIDAKITALVGNKIQLQLFTESGQKQATVLNIERSQLVNAPPTLKVGQNLNLSVNTANGNLTVNGKTDNAAQPIDAKITALVGNKIQLQFFTEPGQKQATVLNIERSQLVNAPPTLKVGQNMNLSVNAANGNLTVNGKTDNAAQPIDAKITALVGNKIQLQFFTEPGQKQATVLNIERSQLVNAPPTLKVGQNLSLEAAKTVGAPAFKIIAPSAQIQEAKVAEFITQFLPRHEAAPIFLNQLIKDLPQLIENKSVSQALKDIAAKIIQNLPPKEQLITSQGLKQSITNSGLFLEAKLPATMSQADLINALPQLIKNESVPQSLQRIAAEILQNLTQKQPSPAPQPLAPDAPDATKASEQQPLKTLKPETTSETKTAMPMGEDFKANLLKFIHALKLEITQQSEQKTNQVDIELLKNLQNKSENTVAKVVLEQLMSLPKEDNPKQLWIIDLPFIDRQQAETVKIEIQQDKGNNQQTDSGNWSVNITITPPELGTIHCAVSYRNDAINTFFQSQNSQTTDLIKHNLDYLKNQLEASGLKTGQMDAHNGIQKTPSAPPHKLTGRKLFDDKA
ncbi:MAG: flagellar hook-length control protein FliK [Methylobacter sp.]|nr:flagellar hook-length control protein FliK [Methylobacter sp.]MDP2428654.1 flagellar hook-length control protein FliK [Methylobacter sp.]